MPLRIELVVPASLEVLVGGILVAVVQAGWLGWRQRMRMIVSGEGFLQSRRVRRSRTAVCPLALREVRVSREASRDPMILMTRVAVELLLLLLLLVVSRQVGSLL